MIPVIISRTVGLVNLEHRIQRILPVGKRFALTKIPTCQVAQFATTHYPMTYPRNAMDWKLPYEATSLDLWTESIVVEYEIFIPFVLRKKRPGNCSVAGPFPELRASPAGKWGGFEF